MFQDGSVKSVLAKSFLNPEGLSPELVRAPKFILPFSKVSTSIQRVAALLRHAFSPKRPSSLKVARFYRFLLNGFKSFNLLFKILFIFPSQYLFAIGFSSIFSLRWSYHLLWTPIPRSSTLWVPQLSSFTRPVRGFHPLCPTISSKLCDRTPTCWHLEITIPLLVQKRILTLGFCLFIRHY